MEWSPSRNSSAFCSRKSGNAFGNLPFDSETGNQVFLLIGIRYSQKDRNRQHPFSYCSCCSPFRGGKQTLDTVPIDEQISSVEFTLRDAHLNVTKVYFEPES